MSYVHAYGIVALVLCCAACEKVHGNGEVGSESHFLACDRSSECAALGDDFECRHGACTRMEEPAANTPPPVAGSRAPTPPSSPVPTAPPVQPSRGCSPATPFEGNDRCLVPPDSKAGVQIHIGPRDYSDSAEVAEWVLEPGLEIYKCFSFRTPNTNDVFYESWEYSSRPGMHHSVLAMFDLELEQGLSEICVHPGTLEPGQFIGMLPSVSGITASRTMVAQENRSVGMPVPTRAFAQAQLHVFNFTDRPLLPEVWLNLYYPQQMPTQEARPLRLIGGVDWVIQPSTEHMARFECPITSAGRLLSLMPHPLESTQRMDAWLRRTTGERLHLLQTALGSEPQTYDYDSLTTNPFFSDLPNGAHSGIVALEAGDTLEWECHIQNEFPEPLTHIHDQKRGAICDLTGMTVGTQVDCAMP
jgi:hypothetical protein